MSGEALIRDLARLGEEAWPETPDLASRVVARLPEGAPARRRDARPSGRRWRRAAVVFAVLLLLPAAGAVAFPGARDDVLEWLGLRSVEVQRVPELPPAAREPAPDERGALVTLAVAGRRAGFEPALPPKLARPDEVRVRDDGAITLVHGDLLLTERRGALDDVLLRKIVTGDARVRRVPGGLFFTGRHAYVYAAPDGSFREERTYLAGNALVVQRGDLLLRLEGRGLTYERARRLLAP